MDTNQSYYADLKKRVQGKVYKSCFVPACQSSTMKTRKKTFVSVPTDLGLRRQWAAMARRVDAKTLKSSSQWYCCEDHFEPENDFNNYRHYMLMGPSIKLTAKKGVLPHKFECQKDRPHLKPRPSSMRRLQRATIHGLTQTHTDDKMEDVSIVADRAADAAGSVAGRAADAAGGVAGRAGVAAGGVADRAADAAGSVAGRAGVAAGRAAGATGAVAGRGGTAAGGVAGGAAGATGAVTGRDGTAAGRAAGATGAVAGRDGTAAGGVAGRAAGATGAVAGRAGTVAGGVAGGAAGATGAVAGRDGTSAGGVAGGAAGATGAVAGSDGTAAGVYVNAVSDYEPSDNSSSEDSGEDHNGVPYSEENEMTSDDSSKGEVGLDDISLRRIRLLCLKDPKRYIGVPPDAMFIIRVIARTKIAPSWSPTSRLEPLDVCLLVLMKIKLHRSFAFIADDFGISRSYAGRLFARYVEVLASALSQFIAWPSDEMTLQKQLPLAFKARFRSVVAIVDCLEIEIEKPSAALKQARSWSQYKGGNTLKYLVSITPNGMVNFVSLGFGGRVSDMHVIRRCGFLNHLKPGASVMADRGFKGIESLLSETGCTLIRPKSVQAGVVHEASEVKFSKQVASLRIHVERAIRRVREFEMLRPHACINSRLVPLTDACMTIACGLVNLQSRLTKM